MTSRRDFLSGLAAAAAALVLPYEPKRVYSFAAPWVSEQAEFERALATGLIRGGTWRIHAPTKAPPGAIITGANLMLDRDGVILLGGRLLVQGCFINMADGWCGERGAVCQSFGPGFWVAEKRAVDKLITQEKRL